MTGENVAPVASPAPSSAPVSENQCFRPGAVDWVNYRQIAQALTGRHVRLTYDRGLLELMTISGTPGNSGRLLGRFLSVLAEEFQVPLRSFGDRTFAREDLDRGVEPDDSFYLTNEPLIRAKDEIDLATDPPPNLVTEIDISRNSRRRMSIYAAMRVPEVWQYNGQRLQVWQLGADGQYGRSTTSRYFGTLPVADLNTFLQQRTQRDEIALVRSFRDWVREFLAGDANSKKAESA